MRKGDSRRFLYVIIIIIIITIFSEFCLLMKNISFENFLVFGYGRSLVGLEVYGVLVGEEFIHLNSSLDF